MKAFYEQKREKERELSCEIGTEFEFPEHFHVNIEILLLLEGKYDIIANGKITEVEKGDIIFFDSYDVHGYKRKSVESKGILLILSKSYFLENINKKGYLKSNVIKDERLFNELCFIATKYIANEENLAVKEAGVKLFLAKLYEKAQFTVDKGIDETSLVKSVLSYIHDNYKEDLTLSVISKHFGYTSEHVSRTFHRYLKKSIPSYINGLRLAYVEKETAQKNRKLYEIVYESGFNSLQTYYRVKKASKI